MRSKDREPIMRMKCTRWSARALKSVRSKDRESIMRIVEAYLARNDGLRFGQFIWNLTYCARPNSPVDVWRIEDAKLVEGLDVFLKRYPEEKT